MVDKTPAIRKQTVWFQGLTFVVLLLITVTDNEWFMTTFTQAGVYAGMILNLSTIILSFLKPIGYDRNNPVEKALRDEHEIESI